MYKNGLSYVGAALSVLLAHCAMLFVVFFNGNYDSSQDVFILAGTVIGFDLVYFAAMMFFKQMTYSIDFMLILILNASLIFQSCFGKVGLSTKHLITCVAALVACRLGYLLCRSHKWIQTKKREIFIVNLIIIASILTLTGSRSMWIDLGFMTIQPSEFLKPAFVLACATSIEEQQKKTKILCFNVVKMNIALFGLIVLICGLQWWCRDLGTENPTEEELAFWTDVFETHRKIVTHAKKPKTEKQIRKWLADPYTDSAEYRIWGNGICLANAFFVLAGIAWCAGLEE